MSSHRTAGARDGDGGDVPRVLRPVRTPVVVAVETGGDGEPVALVWRERRVAVATVLERWRIDDEWWRTPRSRLYRRLLLADDRLLAVFEDLITGRWYVQRYHARRSLPPVGQQRLPPPSHRPSRSGDE